MEFQVLADHHGNVVHLGERDCSVQRRFQKLVEEAPCPIVSPFWRMKMGAAAIDVALALDYVGALTVEFFYFPEVRQFYFNEINSRLQVEHCVTELVTGIDIIREQIRIAQREEEEYREVPGKGGAHLPEAPGGRRGVGRGGKGNRHLPHPRTIRLHLLGEP